MNSIKCPSCGLVNFADSAACKRCGGSFQFDGQSSSASLTMPETYTPIMPSQHDVRNIPSSYAKPNTYEESSVHLKKIITGALWAGGGTILTVAGYSSASGGGKYIVFWGAILFGIVDMIIGIKGYLGSGNS